MVKDNVVTSQPTESFISFSLNLFHQRIVTGFAARDEREKADFPERKGKKNSHGVYRQFLLFFNSSSPQKKFAFLILFQLTINKRLSKSMNAWLMILNQLVTFL